AEEIRKLHEQHGPCREEAKIDADNALRGTWVMPCDKGSLSVRITLAPTVPPKVQFLNIRSIMPPSDAMRSAIESKLTTIPAHWGKCAIAQPLSETAVEVKCERGDLAARVAQGNVTFVPIISADQRCVP